MYRAQSFSEQMMDSRSEDDYIMSNDDSSPGHKYLIKFTPPTESRISSRNRFSSPSMLSKSVPRRKMIMMRSRINRSLNFDIGHRGNNNYGSPKANSPNGNIHLSRSAKILKALNIDMSPMKTDCKKINKTLNFDLTPSPRKNSNTSPCSMSNLTLNSPRINKTLNFDSSSESPAPSPHETSTESIDENQNQTPSQRNRKAKKSLSYCSPHSNGKSPDFGLLSPGLRTELREKINDIVQISMTPNISTSRRMRSHAKISDEIVASTPRNLFDDYSEDDDEERPKTPKNSSIPVPESMSAIKKSHKKERVSGRLTRINNIKTPLQMETDDNADRSTTPQSIEEYSTPNYNLRSIKKSHKKDKSKRKSCGYRSEDELSETGSLFDYSEAGKLENDSPELGDNRECEKNFNENLILTENPRIVITDASPLSSVLENDSEQTESKINNKIPEIVIINATPSPSTSSRNPENESPPKSQSETKDTEEQTTPENKSDYLRRIMSDSIKRSHKKIKDSNKKSLFKPRISQQKIDDAEEMFMTPKKTTKDKQEDPSIVTPNTTDRPGTPDNKNSSRLLLNQFSSVKKSHRKDKYRKVGFAQRQINMNSKNAVEESNSSPERNLKNKLSANFHKIPQICITRASTSKSNDSLLSNFSPESEYDNCGTSPLDEDEPKPLISSPNKRKSPSTRKSSKSNSDSPGTKFESLDRGFQIFTPIKKRKSFQATSANDEKSMEVLETPMENERCETPKLSRRTIDNSFKTPRKSVRILSQNTNNENIVDSISNDDENNGHGPSTPENQESLNISALSSIKRSHKKDKWAKSNKRTPYSMRKFIHSHDEKNKLSEENEAQASTSECSILSNDSNSPDCMEKPVEKKSPNSSSTHSKEIEANSPVKTPPNSLVTKTYLRLMQTTSIKRSHKKLRERKKDESIIRDPDLSDDGSLFDEKDRSYYTSFDSECLPLDEDDRPLGERVIEKISSSKRRCHSKNRSESESVVDSGHELGNSQDHVMKTVKRKSSSPK